MKYPEQSSSDSSDMPGSHIGNYDNLHEIGQGAHGVVYKARDLANDGRFVAIKKFKVHTGERGVPDTILREVATLRQLGHYGHNNVIKLLDICNGPSMEREKQLLLYIVFEHMEMDLAEYMQKCPAPGVPADRICSLMKQLFSGVDFLHSHRIIHRDLKPQNILINSAGELKIADFGLAKLYEAQTTLTSVVATLWYRAPEVLLAGTYATPLDIWSCGCIMAELFHGKPLFPGVTEADQLKRILNVIGTPTESEWPADSDLSRRSFGVSPKKKFSEIMPELCEAGEDLLDSLLVFVPSSRISALEALNHKYFKNQIATAGLESIGPEN